MAKSLSFKPGRALLKDAQQCYRLEIIKSTKHSGTNRITQHSLLGLSSSGSILCTNCSKAIREYFTQQNRHHQNDSCIKMGNDESHFNVSLIVRDKVTRQCPQTTTFEEKGEPKQIRTEVPLLTSLTPYR